VVERRADRGVIAFGVDAPLRQRLQVLQRRGPDDVEHALPVRLLHVRPSIYWSMR
jgi:hypothetical protein